MKSYNVFELWMLAPQKRFPLSINRIEYKPLTENAIRKQNFDKLIVYIMFYTEKVSQ